MRLSLRRVTNSRPFISQIDGLRGVAILSVVLLHLRSSLGHGGAVASTLDPFLASVTRRGVELFFVLSGFVLGLPFLSAVLKREPAPTWRAFYLRRLTRIEPPYLLSLILYGAIELATKDSTLKFLGPHLLASTFYCDHLIFQGSNPVNFVIWSLEVEVQFYLLVPLLAMIFRAPRRARRCTWAVSLGIASIAESQLKGSVFQGTLVYFFAFFVCGLLLCDLYLDPPPTLKQGAFWDFPLITWPLLWLLPERYEFVFVPVLTGGLVFGALYGPLSRRLFSLKGLVRIGGMCYSIYLLHVLVIASTTRITKPIHFGSSFASYYLVQALFAVPAVLLVSLIYFLLIERPCMDKGWPTRLKRFVQRPASSPR